MIEQLKEILNSKFSEFVVDTRVFRGEFSFYIKADGLIPICEYFLNDQDFAVHYLADITSVDWFESPVKQPDRFELIYNFFSMKHNTRFFLRIFMPESDLKIPSLTGLWDGANWLEREVYDLMGVEFLNHPDLRKILTPDELEGYPLRRDYPLTYEVPRFSWNKNNPPEVIK